MGGWRHPLAFQILNGFLSQLKIRTAYTAEVSVHLFLLP